MNKKVFIFMVLLIIPLYATQQHKEPTGLVVHQIAHLLFIYAMLVLMFTIKRTVGTKVPGWKNLYMAALFFMIWNIIAFSVHIIQEYIPKDAYTQASYWAVSLKLNQDRLLRIVFYIGKILGPIFNIIPFIYLYRAVRSFARITL